jgi:O-acetylhomoserine/O-acetylserine sulfhydrylase-like pyridoxal-dependent enzyme
MEERVVDQETMLSRKRGFTTRAVHAGERSEGPAPMPTVTPIHPSVSYLADDPETQDAVFGGEQPGYVYTRHGNPTVRALEVAIAALEET